MLSKLFLIIAASFNEPQFCSSATWNATAITFANNNTIGTYPYGIFVNTNNTVYVANQQYSLIQVWLEGNHIPTTITLSNNSYPYSIFVTVNGDIYVDNGNSGVDKWRLNKTSSDATLYVGGKCYDLFIDSNNSLYCSLYFSHQVIKRSLNDSDYQLTTVAGAGCPGFRSNMLFYARGIFVDKNFNLYVADSNNHRIQFFRSGQLNATTIAGTGAPGTIALSYPTDIVLDAEGYLFIVDESSYRIVGSDLNGFRCIVGCYGGGSGSNQLLFSQTMAFDRYGNIYVVDTSNHRIQEFLLATNSCSKYRDI